MRKITILEQYKPGTKENQALFTIFGIGPFADIVPIWLRKMWKYARLFPMKEGVHELGRRWDVIVVGGGFYGCLLAAWYAKRGAQVALLEKNGDLLQEASYVNQARVHNGYHYPRSVLTALRSRENLPRFIADFPDAVDQSFEKYYAIAKHGSKVNSRQFELFCRSIGAYCEPVDDSVMELFDSERIDTVFRVQEYAFDAERLRQYCVGLLDEAGVSVFLHTMVEKILVDKMNEGQITGVQTNNGQLMHAETVVNVTYAGINSLLERSGLPLLPLRYEWTEMGLVQPPQELQGLGVTVMDGPYFSMMPFPARGLYSVSHVRYTPHRTWTDDANNEAWERPETTNLPFMVSDIARYMPRIRDAVVHDSIYTVKTVLQMNDRDDGRPILLRKHHGTKNLHVIMGGKIDNIYDIIEALEDAFPLEGSAAAKSSVK